MNLINPYELFGITPSSNIHDLRRSYYNLALSCHPDKGGDHESMRVLAIAYRWIYEQFQESTIRQKTFEEYFGDQLYKQNVPNYTETLAESYGYTKEAFYNICDSQGIQKAMQETLYVPTFQWILTHFTEPPTESNAWLHHAIEFLEKYKTDMLDVNTLTSIPVESTYIPMTVPHGYGNRMDKNENEEYYHQHSNEYRRQMISYQEPTIALTTTIASLQSPQRLDDYTVQVPLPMYDYEEAFTTSFQSNNIDASMDIQAEAESLEYALEQKLLQRAVEDTRPF